MKFYLHKTNIIVVEFKCIEIEEDNMKIVSMMVFLTVALTINNIAYADCGPKAPSVDELKDTTSPSGLHIDKVLKRQHECRSKGIGNDISTTLVLVMGNKKKIKNLVSQISQSEKAIDVHQGEISKEEKKTKTKYIPLKP
jgi:hypothetical protein